MIQTYVQLRNIPIANILGSTTIMQVYLTIYSSMFFTENPIMK